MGKLQKIENYRNSYILNWCYVLAVLSFWGLPVSTVEDPTGGKCPPKDPYIHPWGIYTW
jgi:hypothetical protein